MPRYSYGAEPSRSNFTSAEEKLKREFARRLRDVMKEASLFNQSEIARRVGVDRSNISMYVRGRQLPSPKVLTKLADVLGCSTADLLPVQEARQLEGSLGEFVAKEIPGDDEHIWLRIDKIVSMKVYRQIARLIIDAE